jgi:hypothetical protein
LISFLELKKHHWALVHCSRAAPMQLHEYVCSEVAELLGSLFIWTASRGAVAEFSDSLVALTMQSCNGRQAVMSALEALDLAGMNRMNAFLVLLACPLLKYAV